MSPHVRAMVPAFQALATAIPPLASTESRRTTGASRRRTTPRCPPHRHNRDAPPPPTWGQRHSTAGQAVDRDYLLIPAYELGLIVLDVSYPVTAHLDDSAVADIIWIPGGATGVRVIPRSHYATVVDGNGRVLIVDLSNIDQRWNSNGNPIPPDAIFKNAAAALAGTSAYGTGALDPRVVWISPTPLVNSTLPPVIDIDTGIMFAGSVGDQLTKVIAAFDPQIEIRADTGRGGTNQIGGIVPLGVDPPAGAIGTSAPGNASLGAFRLRSRSPAASPRSLPTRSCSSPSRASASGCGRRADPRGRSPAVPALESAAGAPGRHERHSRRSHHLPADPLCATQPGYGAAPPEGIQPVRLAVDRRPRRSAREHLYDWNGGSRKTRLLQLYASASAARKDRKRGLFEISRAAATSRSVRARPHRLRSTLDDL